MHFLSEHEVIRLIFVNDTVSFKCEVDNPINTIIHFKKLSIISSEFEVNTK